MTSRTLYTVKWKGAVCRVWYHFCIKGNHRYVYVSSSIHKKVFPGFTVVKNPPANSEDAGNSDSIPGLGISPGVGNGKPLQYSCLENSMVRGAWRATVHGVTQNRTRLRHWARRPDCLDLQCWHYHLRVVWVLLDSVSGCQFPLLETGYSFFPTLKGSLG